MLAPAMPLTSLPWLDPGVVFETCVGDMQGMRPVTGAMLENIHLGENICERGLPRADRGS